MRPSGRGGGGVVAEQPVSARETSIRHTITALRIMLGLLFIALAVLVWDRLGEGRRTADAVAAVAARQDVEIRSTCAFERDIAGLAGQTPSPSKILVSISTHARDAYLAKHCDEATDPLTGHPFGRPPSIPAPAPTPSGR